MELAEAPLHGNGASGRDIMSFSTSRRRRHDGLLMTALWCKSNFSFLEGASHPEELVEEAARLGVDAVAVTDRDGVYGIPRAHFAAKACGMKLIVGSEVTVMTGATIVLLCMT